MEYMKSKTVSKLRTNGSSRLLDTLNHLFIQFDQRLLGL